MQRSSATRLQLQAKFVACLYFLMSTAYFRPCIQLVVIFIQMKHILLSRFQEISSQCDSAGFRVCHCSNKPVISRTTCLNDITISPSSARLSSHTLGMAFQNSEFFFSFIKFRSVIPEHKLQRAVIHCCHRQLMCFRILHSAIKITQCIIRSACQETCIRKNRVM